MTTTETTTTARTTTRADRPRTARDIPKTGQFVAMLGVAVRDRLPLAGLMGLLSVLAGIGTGALWPPLKDTFAALDPELTRFVGDALAGADFTTPGGWVNAELMSILMPALVIAAAVLSVARGIGGEEENHTLGVLLSAPVSRSSFVAAKVAAMVVHLLIVTVCVALGLVLSSVFFDLGLTTNGIVGVSLHLVLVAVFFGAVATLVAAITGQFRPAAIAAAGLMGVSFLLSVVLPLIDSLADLARISPWYYYNSSDPLTNGADVVHLAVLGVAAVVVAVPSFLVIRRRDLRG